MRSKRLLILGFCLFLLSFSHSSAWAGTATLSWDATTTHVDGTPLTDLAGYRVYYGTASYTYTQVVDVGLTATPSNPTYTVLNLATGNTYYFSVTAYDASGNESAFSDEASNGFSVPDTTPPGDPRNFSAVAGDQQITLSWTNPRDPDFAGVRILYRTDDFPQNINDGTLLGDFTGQPNKKMSITHSGLQNGVTYYYAAHSYDIHGNYQSTAHASAMPSFNTSDSQGTIGGGCGMIFPKDGNPPGPGQAADMLILLAVMLILLIKRKNKSLKIHVRYLHPKSRWALRCLRKCLQRNKYLIAVFSGTINSYRKIIQFRIAVFTMSYLLD